MGQPPSLSEEGDWHLLEYVPDDSFSKYVIRFDVHFPQFCQFFQVGMRQPTWTGYAAYPSRLLRPAIVSYTVLPPSRKAFSLPSRYQRM